MKIALDFDGTFTLAPQFWLMFINDARTIGHTVYIVTARDEFNDGIDWSKCGLTRRPCDVIFCDGRQKRKIVREYGIEVDVWIDNNPAAIVLAGISFGSPEDLAAWRRRDQYRGSKLPITGESRGFDSGGAQGSNRDQREVEGSGATGRPRLQQRSDKGPGQRQA